MWFLCKVEFMFIRRRLKQWKKPAFLVSRSNNCGISVQLVYLCENRKVTDILKLIAVFLPHKPTSDIFIPRTQNKFLIEMFCLL